MIPRKTLVPATREISTAVRLGCLLLFQSTWPKGLGEWQPALSPLFHHITANHTIGTVVANGTRTACHIRAYCASAKRIKRAIKEEEEGTWALTFLCAVARHPVGTRHAPVGVSHVMPSMIALHHHNSQTGRNR